jgi:hypothetical protein
MPDLSDLQPQLQDDRMLGTLLGVLSPPTPRGRQLADGFVRQTERSLRHYLKARSALTAFVETGQGPLLRDAQDSVEVCIGALHRAVEYLERLRRMGFQGPDGAAFIPRPRDLEVLSPDVRGRVRNFRHRLEHIDEDIAADRLPPDADATIQLRRERAEIAGEALDYPDIARWIRQLYDFAAKVSHFTIRIGPPSESRSAGEP